MAACSSSTTGSSFQGASSSSLAFSEEERGQQSPESVQWEIRVKSAVFSVTVTLDPCGHQVPFSYVLTQFSQLSERSNTLERMERELKKPLSGASLADRLTPADRHRIERRIKRRYSRVKSGCERTGNRIQCFCGQSVAQVKLITPEHLTFKGSDQISPKLKQKESLKGPEHERAEIEHPKTEESIIENITYQKAALHLQRIQQLLDHLTNINRMSDKEFSESLRFLYKLIIQPNATSPASVQEPVQAQAEDEIELRIDPADEPVIQDDEALEAPLVENAPEAQLMIYDRFHLAMGDGLTCHRFDDDCLTPLQRARVYGLILLLLAMLGTAALALGFSYGIWALGESSKESYELN